MMKISVLLILSAVVALATAVAHAVELSYDVVADRISVRAHNAPAVELLSRIAAATGIKVEIDPQLAQERISVERESVPLEQFMHESLRRYSYALRYGNQNGLRRIISLTLLPKGTPSGRGLVLVPPADDHASWERSRLEVAGPSHDVPASIKALQSEPRNATSPKRPGATAPAEPRAIPLEDDSTQSAVPTPQMISPRSKASEAAAGSITP